MTTQPELNAETILGIASALRYSEKLCKSRCYKQVESVGENCAYAREALLALFDANTKLTEERDALAARVAELEERAGVTVKVAPINGETTCRLSPDGRHQVDTSMEEGPNNCFHCGAYMGRDRAALKGNGDA